MIKFHDNRYEVYLLAKEEDGKHKTINVAGFKIEESLNRFPSCVLDMALEDESGKSILDYDALHEGDMVVIKQTEPAVKTIFTGVVSKLQAGLSSSGARLMVSCEHELAYLSKFNLLDVYSSRSVVGASDYLYNGFDQYNDIEVYLERPEFFTEIIVPTNSDSEPQSSPSRKSLLNTARAARVWDMIRAGIIRAMYSRMDQIGNSLGNSACEAAIIKAQDNAKEGREATLAFIERLEVLLYSIKDAGCLLLTDDEPNTEKVHSSIARQISGVVKKGSKYGHVWNLVLGLANQFNLNIIPVTGENYLGYAIPRDPLKGVDVRLHKSNILALTPHEASHYDQVAMVALTNHANDPFNNYYNTLNKKNVPTIYPPNSQQNLVENKITGVLKPINSPTWLQSKHTDREGTITREFNPDESSLGAALNHRYAKAIFEWESLLRCTATVSVVDEVGILPGQVIQFDISDPVDGKEASTVSLGYVVARRFTYDSGGQESVNLTVSHYRLKRGSSVSKFNSTGQLYDMLPRIWPEYLNNIPTKDEAFFVGSSRYSAEEREADKLQRELDKKNASLTREDARTAFRLEEAKKYQ